MRRSTRGPVRWWPVRLGVLGCAMVFCWWQIRLLGDVRVHLGKFYGWFATAFVFYLLSLWLVHRVENIGDVARFQKHSNVPMLGLGGVLLAAVLARLLLLGTAPTLSDDIYRYRWDGRVQLAGVDPYAYPPNHPTLASLRDEQFAHINFPHLRTVYPPLTEFAFRLGASLGHTLTAQKLVFVSAELVTFTCLLFLLLKRRMNPLWVVAYAWHPLVILEIAGSGHNDALGVAMLWLGIAGWEARSWLGVTFGWSAAFLSKFLSVIMMPWWWCRRESRRWLGVCAILSAAPLLLHPTAVTALRESLSAMTTRFESNASLYLVLAWMVGSASLARVLAVGVGVAFLLWWAHRQADPTRYLLGALSVAALLSPVLHPWYLVWLIPCLCFYRPAPVVALTGFVVLAYTVWPGRLADGRWVIPVWAHALEYAPVFLLGLWELKKWGRFYFPRRMPEKIETSPI